MASAPIKDQAKNQVLPEDTSKESEDGGATTTKDTSDATETISNNLTTSSMFRRVLNRIANEQPLSDLQSSSSTSLTYSLTQPAVSGSSNSCSSVDISKGSANSFERVLRQVGAAHNSSDDPLPTIPPCQEQLCSSGSSANKIASKAINSLRVQSTGSQVNDTLETSRERKRASFFKPPLPLPVKSSASQSSGAQTERKSSGAIINETNGSDDAGSRPSLSPVTNSDCESGPLFLFVSASAEKSARCSGGNSSSNNPPENERHSYEIAALTVAGDCPTKTREQPKFQQNIANHCASTQDQRAPLDSLSTGNDDPKNSECLQAEARQNETSSRKAYENARRIMDTENRTTGNQTKTVSSCADCSSQDADVVFQGSPPAKKSKKSLGECKKETGLISQARRIKKQQITCMSTQLILCYSYPKNKRSTYTSTTTQKPKAPKQDRSERTSTGGTYRAGTKRQRLRWR